MTIEDIDLSETDVPAGDPTPAARPKRNRKWWLGFLAGFLVVVLGTEVALRLAESKLPQPQFYFSANAQTVAEEMDILKANGITSDLTFMGTSMVRRGVDANYVEKELGMDYVHNVALPGAQTPIVERWLLEEVVPRIQPKKVVWGIQSIDFNGGRERKNIGLYNQARATKQGVYGDLDRLLEDASATSKYRNELRDPVELSGAIRSDPKRYLLPRPLGDRAVWKLEFKKATDAELARVKRAHEKDIREQQLVDFSIGKDEMRAYEHTLSELKRQGIETAVVIMPVPKKYFDMHTNGRADWEKWRAAVTAAAEKAGVPIYDMAESMPDDAFRDYEHLFPKPAREFDSLLDDKLKALGW